MSRRKPGHRWIDECGPCSLVGPKCTMEGTIVPDIHIEEKTFIILLSLLKVLYNAQALSTNVVSPFTLNDFIALKCGNILFRPGRCSVVNSCNVRWPNSFAIEAANEPVNDVRSVVRGIRPVHPRFGRCHQKRMVVLCNKFNQDLFYQIIENYFHSCWTMTSSISWK